MTHQPMDSDEMFTNEEHNIIINAVDGLPNLHPNYNEFKIEKSESKAPAGEGTHSLEEIIHDEDLPTSLIVTNIDNSVFQNEEAKVYISIKFIVIFSKAVSLFKMISFNKNKLRNTFFISLRANAFSIFLYFRRKFRFYFHNLESLNLFSFLGVLKE